MAPSPKRADLVLVERGLFESRARARAAVEAGNVTADAAPVAKPSDMIAENAVLQAEPAHPFVSRGGVKLAGALEHYPIPIEDHVCLDVGASTGGFTEVLLARGARRVVSIDVGRDQLHARLRARPEVISLEATDVRALDPARLGEPPEIVAVDVSFISLKLVLPAALALAAPRATLVALIKPQFEAPRRRRKKGVVRAPEEHDAACADIAACVTSLGWTVIATFPSPIEGGDGNREFFIGARRG